MKIGIYTRRDDSETLQAIEQLTLAMQQRGIEPVPISSKLPCNDLQYVISVGGDGTLLSAVHIIGQATIPVVGLNYGHLGFLTTAGRNDINNLLDDLLNNRCISEERTMLDIRYNGENLIALNEAVLHRAITAELLNTDIFINDEYIATYGGNGVIIATPTGSTAYSMSCGGPILTPDCGGLVLTPIAAHTLTLRPIIVPDNSTIRLITDNSHPNIHLCLDSQQFTVQGGTEITIARAPHKALLTRLPNQTFFTAIRQKLSWGK